MSPLAIAAAVETLQRAGWTLSAPELERMRMIPIPTVADLLGVGETTARGIVRSLPGTVRLPGGELRARASDLERWIEERRIKP